MGGNPNGWRDEITPSIVANMRLIACKTATENFAIGMSGLGRRGKEGLLTACQRVRRTYRWDSCGFDGMPLLNIVFIGAPMGSVTRHYRIGHLVHFTNGP